MLMLEVKDVSMKFVMANDKMSSIKEFVTAFLSRKLKFQEFWALRKVDFEVEKGEVVGIIGRNGAGKSTLLKIISGILSPTTGTVTRRGNIVPMLELGSGFDFDLTGQENIFLNGAILGYSREFLEEKYDEIVEFSELGDFIRMPIRNYSSGMLMRLAFSIATVVQPEILIVDEILAVGDENFQKKSKARMMELMGGGTTVLFVSHDLQQIREMCNRVVWLEDGLVKMFGDSELVCDAYDISAPDTRRNLKLEEEKRRKQEEEALRQKEAEVSRVSPRDFVMPQVMQFDQYQRYESTAKIAEADNPEGRSDYKVLEIGADGRKQLGSLLPGMKTNYLNRSFPAKRRDDPECIVSELFSMPGVADHSYDLVTALEILGSIKKQKRAAFINELMRVADVAVLSFPFQSEENVTMERELSAYYKNIYGTDYIWFQEHLKNGLLRKEEVEEELAALGYAHWSFEHGETALTGKLLEAQFHFEYYRTGLVEQIEDVSAYYENEIYPHDVGEHNYRCFMIVSREKARLEQIRSRIECEFRKEDDTEQRYEILMKKIGTLKEVNRALDESEQ